MRPSAPGQALEEGPPVGEPGQGVVAGLVGQAPLGGLAGAAPATRMPAAERRVLRWPAANIELAVDGLEAR